MSKNILLISEQILKDRSMVHSNIDPKLLYPEIKVAQDMYILPIIGSGLFNRLLEGIEQDNLTVDEKKLIDEYIIDTLIHYTLCELPMSISLQFWNKGVMRKTSDNTEVPSMSSLIDLANKHKNRAEYYANRLRRFLKEKITIYPLYNNPGDGIDDVIPDDTIYSMPIYLGDTNYYKKSYKDKYQGDIPNC